jgi:hypothetical protein
MAQAVGRPRSGAPSQVSDQIKRGSQCDDLITLV